MFTASTLSFKYCCGATSKTLTTRYTVEKNSKIRVLKLQSLLCWVFPGETCAADHRSGIGMQIAVYKRKIDDEKPEPIRRFITDRYHLRTYARTVHTADTRVYLGSRSTGYLMNEPSMWLVFFRSSTRSQNRIEEWRRKKKRWKRIFVYYCNSNRIRWQFFRMTNTGVIDWGLDPPTQRTAARYITAILLTTIINTVQWFFCQFFLFLRDPSLHMLHCHVYSRYCHTPSTSIIHKCGATTVGTHSGEITTII